MGVVDRDVGGELALAALFLIWTLLDTVRRSRLEIGRPVDIGPAVASVVPLPAKQNNRSVFFPRRTSRDSLSLETAQRNPRTGGGFFFSLVVSGCCKDSADWWPSVQPGSGGRSFKECYIIFPMQPTWLREAKVGRKK